MAMKRDDGTNYELSSINNFSSLVGKWLKDNGMADIDGDAFKTYQEVKKAKLKLLKKDKKGNRPNRAEPVTFEEEDKLWESGEFGIDSPLALTRTLWWYTSMMFGLRGRDESRKMKWGDVKLLTDENGDDYLQFEERDTKTRTGENQNESVRTEDVPQQDSAGALSGHGVQRIREAATRSYERRRKPLLSRNQPCSEVHGPDLVHEGSHGEEQVGRAAKIRVRFRWCAWEENQPLGEKDWNEKGS